MTARVMSFFFSRTKLIAREDPKRGSASRWCSQPGGPVLKEGLKLSVIAKTIPYSRIA